jgi:hypothetical protein
MGRAQAGSSTRAAARLKRRTRHHESVNVSVNEPTPLATADALIASPGRTVSLKNIHRPPAVRRGDRVGDDQDRDAGRGRDEQQPPGVARDPDE